MDLSDDDDDDVFRSPLNGLIRSVPPALHPALAEFVVCAADGARMYDLMRDALDLLDDHRIEHWLMAGTLLGAVRHGGIIPWDDDARRAARLARRGGEARAPPSL